MLIKLCILSNSAKFSAGRLLLPAYNFSAIMGSTSSTYRLGAVTSLKILATENVPWITVKVHIVDYSRQRIPASLNGSPQNLDTRLVWCQGWNLLSKNFPSHPYKIWRGKPQIYPNLSRTAVNRKRVTSKRLIISTNNSRCFVYNKKRFYMSTYTGVTNFEKTVPFDLSPCILVIMMMKIA